MNVVSDKLTGEIVKQIYVKGKIINFVIKQGYSFIWVIMIIQHNTEKTVI